MNNNFDAAYSADSVNFDAIRETDNDLALILSENISGEQVEGSASITDEEAELLLPGYAIAFEEYHQRRAEGASPDEALQMTMQQWRKFWSASAYVPHRRC